MARRICKRVAMRVREPGQEVVHLKFGMASLCLIWTLSPVSIMGIAQLPVTLELVRCGKTEI